jgi:hypothetical protein
MTIQQAIPVDRPKMFNALWNLSLLNSLIAKMIVLISMVQGSEFKVPAFASRASARDPRFKVQS